MDTAWGTDEAAPFDVKAHAYQCCFAWSSLFEFAAQKAVVRPTNSFHIFHIDNNG